MNSYSIRYEGMNFDSNSPSVKQLTNIKYSFPCSKQRFDTCKKKKFRLLDGVFATMYNKFLKFKKKEN